MVSPASNSGEDLDKLTLRDLALLPLTFLGLMDDREIRFIKGLRRTQWAKLQCEDFANFNRKERVDLINEYSRSIYTRKHTKATNRLMLVALFLTGFTGYVALESLMETKRAASARSSPAKIIVTGIPPVQMKVIGGRETISPESASKRP
jgi:transcriptional regulator of met regulon